MIDGLFITNRSRSVNACVRICHQIETLKTIPASPSSSAIVRALLFHNRRLYVGASTRLPRGEKQKLISPIGRKWRPGFYDESRYTQGPSGKSVVVPQILSTDIVHR